MHDLADRLEELGNAGIPRGAARVWRDARTAAQVLREADTREPRNGRRPVVVALAVLAVIAIAAVVIVVAPKDSARVSVPPAGRDSDPSLLSLFDTSAEPALGPTPLYLVPDRVPDGMSLFRAGGGGSTSRGGSPDIERQQHWVRVDGGPPHPEVHEFVLSWSTPKSPGASLGDSGNDEIVNVRGQQAVLTPDGGWLAWQEPDGRVVTIRGEQLTRDNLLQIADSLTTRDDGGFTVTTAPDRYVFAYESPGIASRGTNPRELVYSAGTARGIRIYIADDTEYPPGTALSTPGAGAPPTVVEARGRHALLTSGYVNLGGAFDNQMLHFSKPSAVVTWLEPQNVVVVVSAVGLSADETLAVARGLHVADQAEWDLLVAQAPGRTNATAPSGPPPTFTGDEADIAAAFLAWLDADTTDQVVDAIETGEALRATITRADEIGASNRTAYSGRVEAIRIISADRALVTYSLLGPVTLPNQQGAAIRVNGRWLVSRETYCALIGISIQCPPR